MAKERKNNPKLDFDKDYLFNLIMPSDSGPARLAPDQELPEDLAREQLDLSQPQAPEPDSLQRLKERLFAKPDGVAFAPPRQLILLNLMETLVADRLDAAFEKFNCCRCDKCKRDVAALALNSLPPHYVLCDPENLQAQLDACSTKEVAGALIKAILHVKNHPQH